MFLNEVIINGENYSSKLFFDIQVLEENLLIIFSKYFKETMKGILNGGKTLRKYEEKYILVCEMQHSEYQLIKSMC